MFKKFKYTFASEVLTYLNPQLKYSLGRTNHDIAEKLQKNEILFILKPKDVDRHRNEDLKHSIVQ